VLKELLAAEKLVIGILDPARGLILQSTAVSRQSLM
jgi:hypothetical protein